MIRFTTALIVCVLFGTPLHAAELDHDGDAKSDFMFVSNSGSGPLNWQYVSSGDFVSAVSLGSLGGTGHFLIPGYWTQRSTPEIGVLSISTDKKTVDWTIIDREGITRRVSFGGPKDKLLSGGDYNGDGIDGAAVITKTGAAQIYTNFFASGITLDLRFSKEDAKSGIPVAVSRNGLNDLLGLVYSKGKGKKRKSYVTTLTTVEQNSGEQETTTFSSLKRKVVEAFPVAGGNGVDNIALVTSDSGKKTIELYSLSGAQVSARVVEATNEFVVGDYLDEAGEEIGMYSKGALTIYNPVTGFSVSRTGLPNATIVDHNNAYSFKKSKDEDSAKGTSRCEVKRKVVDGGGNWLHKPVSDSTGSIVNLFNPSDNPSACRYENKNGKKVKDAYLSGHSNPDRPTWSLSAEDRAAVFLHHW